MPGVRGHIRRGGIARNSAGRPSSGEPWAALLLAILAACGGAGGQRPAHDPALHRLPLYLYPAANSSRPPRAVVFFFGNDLGFWRPHQRLAERLAGGGYGVAGFDARQLMQSLPDGPPARRDSAFAAAIAPIIAGARRELGGGNVPLVVAGHSIGAELAVWTAAHVRPPGMAGVLAMSPGSRGHLRVTLSDLANGAEPTEPGSFAVAATVAAIPESVRVALVRGQHDRYRFADPAILAAGRRRLSRFVVPFGGHSMKSVALGSIVVRRALSYLLTG